MADDLGDAGPVPGQRNTLGSPGRLAQLLKRYGGPHDGYMPKYSVSGQAAAGIGSCPWL
jgi:hypothetical protein